MKCPCLLTESCICYNTFSQSNRNSFGFICIDKIVVLEFVLLVSHCVISTLCYVVVTKIYLRSA
jgi:hypothetical protein